MQVCPVAAKIPEITPLTASSMLASSNTIVGRFAAELERDLLKSLGCEAHRPSISPPVKAIFDTLGCATSGSPTSLPKPVTTLTTPFGNSASSISLQNSSIETEVCSDGLTTIVQPAASAGASFQDVSKSGSRPARGV